MSAAASIVLATLVELGTAAPTPAPYQLRWTRAPGAESCIDAAALAEQVAARLGRRVFDGVAATAVVIDGQVAPVAGGWHVTVNVRGPDGAARGARELEQVGADCRALDGSLALVLALIIDLDAAPGLAPPPPAQDGWALEATVAGSGGLGVLPGAGLGARGALAIDAPWLWPVVVGVSWWAPGQADTGAADQGVRLRLSQVEVVVCTPARRLGPVRIAGCGGGGLERIDAVGTGFDRNRQVSAFVPRATIAGRAAVDLRGPTFVAVDLGVEVALTRPRFVFDDGGTMLVYQVAPASLVARLGLGVRF